MKRFYSIFLVIMLLCSTLSYSPALVTAEPAAPTDVPTVVIASGVTSYVLSSPKLFWYTNGVLQCSPADPAAGQAPLVQYPEVISRVASYGSPVRELYRAMRNCDEWQIRSNIAADANYLYWLAASGPGSGLMRLSINANVGDAPELVNGLIHGEGIGFSFVAVNATRIFVIYTDGSGDHVGYVDKSTKSLQPMDGSAHIEDLQADNKFAYYRKGTDLRRAEPGVGVTTIATGVTGYYPEGLHTNGYCSPFDESRDPSIGCIKTNNVYVAKAGIIYVYDNLTGTLSTSNIYSSGDPTAKIYDVVSDSSRLFFAEQIYTGCGLSCYYTKLMRIPKAGGASAALYTYNHPINYGLDNLSADDTFIYWSDAGQIKRLPYDAAALPQVDMWIRGVGSGMEMEVTQGIQSSVTNTVTLIKNRPTFVRLFVKAQSAVSGVTAHLYNNALYPNNPLLPVNPAGTTLTVNVLPDDNDINQSFLFELPLSWTQNGTSLPHSLTLRAVLNPYKMPLEPDYSDNEMITTVYFQNSPSLSVEFFRLNYTWNGTTYSPRIAEDILRTYSWILRAYPLAGGVGENFKPRLWDVDGGTQLAGWVAATDPECAEVYSNPDLRNLCASYFTNGWLFYYRVTTMSGDLNVGLNSNAFYYGMISDVIGFPRGQAMYVKTSVGPAGRPGPYDWDIDGTYADWYAAHEIGHSLGRAHPNAGSDDPATTGTEENCGHSRSDPLYPYGNTTTPATPIGLADKEGFDRGDAGLGIDRAVLPRSIWNDVMSYCSSQWISDYTYKHMYDHMLANPSGPVLADVAGGGGYTGDFLIVTGGIDPAAPSASFSFIRRVNKVTDLPAAGSSGYSLRLLNAADGVLATLVLKVTPEEKSGRLNFSQIMNFAAGTRKVQVVRNSDGLVLATRLVSANAPVVSGVALQGAPNPVSGIVTLAWNASDADGDSLTYDVAYSRDNGITFQPVAINITQKSAQINTAQLGGSATAVFRVTASDGVNSGFANSPAYVMANKPPQPYILNPENNLHVHYGQMVNFNGLALDAQDGSVAASGLVWKNAKNETLGTGPQITLSNLPVGTNVITLNATNSKSLTASASVTVIVDDDLDLPGPTLTAGPSQVGWQVPAGSAQVQAMNISIGNAGSGSLSWTAAEGAGWLALSAASGTVAAGGNPSSLTLTANPAGLSAGKTYTVPLVITKPASGGVPQQKITIPVSISVGVMHDVHINIVYVPMLKR